MKQIMKSYRGNDSVVYSYASILSTIEIKYERIPIAALITAWEFSFEFRFIT